MAGANNAQMKTAGWKARDITKARAERGKLSHDAMRASGYAPKKGFEPATRAKPGAKAESGAPAGWKAAARGEGGDARRAATAARGDYLQKQAADFRARSAQGLRAASAKEVARRAAVSAAKAKATADFRAKAAMGIREGSARAANQRLVMAETQTASKAFFGASKKVDALIKATSDGTGDGAAVRRAISRLEDRTGKPEIRGHAPTARRAEAEIARLKKALASAEDVSSKARQDARYKQIFQDRADARERVRNDPYAGLRR